MMRNGMLLSCSLVVLVCGALACARQENGTAGAAHEDGPSQASDSRPRSEARLAAAISVEIEADPDNAAAILDRNGMTRDQFEALLMRIAADPDLSGEYNGALNR